ncbi:putative 2OG-Fe(II) oxygenase [Sphingomonas sp. GB1N7]|uniref:putative 2OG-Fe(II) oxygenase n=1 Tax=Parasphingomonas caseinilytica TaxID=3096158 RepID=UPI002FCB6A87
MNQNASPSFDLLLDAALAAPGRADLATQLGLRALEERREEDALPILSAAARRFTRDGTLLHVTGLLHRAVGDLNAAIACFDAALPFAPTSARLMHARARAAAEAGLLSLDWYRRARAMAPNDGEVILGEAAALHAAGENMTADAMLSGLLRQHPGWIDGHAVLIRLRYLLGGEATALAELDRAIAVAPRDLALHSLKITVLVRRAAGEQARAALSAAQAALGNSAPLRPAAAIVATEFGDLATADAAFAGLDPLADTDLFINWMRHLLRRQEPERVSALYGHLPPALADHAWPYLSLAWRLTDNPRAAWLQRDEFVRIVDFGTDWPLLAPLTETLRALHLATHQPLDQSVRNGTQTDGPLFSRIDPVIRAVRERLSAEVRDYIAALPAPDPEHPLLGRIPRHPRFVGSWSVRLRDGGFHEPHIHGEGWLSSAFYVALPPAHGEAGWLTLGEPQSSLNLALAPTRLIEPKPGRLVLFPSTQWHGTRPVASGERLTIAFDIA